jgi:hypothetical protein
MFVELGDAIGAVALALLFQRLLHDLVQIAA